MVTSTRSAPVETPGEPLVDHRAPRFGQAVTATGLLIGITLGIPALIYLVMVALLIPPTTRWRYDPYAMLWRGVLHPWFGGPDGKEPAAPHRFAKLLGAVGTVSASLLLILGYPTVGYMVAGLVAAAAGLAAITGLCIGCRLYAQVAFFRRHAIV